METVKNPGCAGWDSNPSRTEAHNLYKPLYHKRKTSQRGIERLPIFHTEFALETTNESDPTTVSVNFSQISTYVVFHTPDLQRTPYVRPEFYFDYVKYTEDHKPVTHKRRKTTGSDAPLIPFSKEPTRKSPRISNYTTS
jgi:hypothetical protein